MLALIRFLIQNGFIISVSETDASHEQEKGVIVGLCKSPLVFQVLQVSA